MTYARWRCDRARGAECIQQSKSSVISDQLFERLVSTRIHAHRSAPSRIAAVFCDYDADVNRPVLAQVGLDALHKGLIVFQGRRTQQTRHSLVVANETLQSAIQNAGLADCMAAYIASHVNASFAIGRAGREPCGHISRIIVHCARLFTKTFEDGLICCLSHCELEPHPWRHVEKT